MEKFIDALTDEMLTAWKKRRKEISKFLEDEKVRCERIITDYKELEEEKWVNRAELIAHEEEIICKINSILENDRQKVS